jgi:hypothetical protein
MKVKEIIIKVKVSEIHTGLLELRSLVIANDKLSESEPYPVVLEITELYRPSDFINSFDFITKRTLEKLKDATNKLMAKKIFFTLWEKKLVPNIAKKEVKNER